MKMEGGKNRKFYSVKKGRKKEKKRQGVLCNGNCPWPKQRQGSCPLCTDQAGLGGREAPEPGMEVLTGSLGVALKDGRTTRAK